MAQNEKLMPWNLPGSGHQQRFAEVEHAEHTGATLKRIIAYFIREKATVLSMLAVVVFGTLCGIFAPSQQSKAIDIIVGKQQAGLPQTISLMLALYLLYSFSNLLQGVLSAKLSQKVVKRMREELFGKLVDLPIRYLDTHSHGDVIPCGLNLCFSAFLHHRLVKEDRLVDGLHHFRRRSC